MAQSGRVLLVDDIPGERINFQAAFGAELGVARDVGQLEARLRDGHQWSVAFVDFNLNSADSTGLTALLRLHHERPETRIVTYSQFNEGGRTLYAAAARHWFGADALLDKTRNEPESLIAYVHELTAGRNPTPQRWQQRLQSAHLIDSLLADASWVRIWAAIREASGDMALVAKILDVGVSSLRSFKDRATEAAIAFNEKFHDQPHPGYSRNKKGILSSFAAEHRHFLTAPDLSTVMSPGTRRR
ncbi:DNA-binding NarL/FixJ family response regulator [Microlunatus panaciterrae]|uniref:DNA-binding NarL/FixJ family response regulator n=1 Tax=Microlunatus panaciterrae TaxID=400768 RepID=A0ABS2RH75_9ACTN|nr:response regulator [Microlunatus panaciterrae]MBM7798358.1 DNA-binding NarL/FixJ family response regulator [Microlunatus panaciterrae]